MKVLFIHSNSPDYVYDSLLHGLRTCLGNDCVDIPKLESMYSPLNNGVKAKLGNHGFTLYGLLSDNPELVSSRFFWQRDIESYDLIVITDIWENWTTFWNLFKKYPHKRFAIVDGHDIPAVFPYNNMAFRIKKMPASFLAPVRKVKYFKREVWGGAECYGVEKFIHPAFAQLFRVPSNIYPISMAIPEEKITRVPAEEKTQTFVSYLIDKDLAQLINTDYAATGDRKHKFTEEPDYYRDLSISRFGPTSKREGWDCLRHYEYAAQGVVLCFKDLNEKHPACAPHGLNTSNALVYKSAQELLEQINNLTPEMYSALLENTYKWVKTKTTGTVATEFLNTVMN